MDPTKSLDLPQTNFEPSQLAFDPSSQSLLLANDSNLLTYNFPTQGVISHSNWGLPQLSSHDPSKEEQEKANKTRADSLSYRLVPVNPNAKVYLSPSGLLATPLSNTEVTLATNTGFSSGVHYWEVICPKNCQNIQIGIIKEGWGANGAKSVSNLYTFQTTTPRIVGVKLDLEKGELRFWLNGGMEKADKTTINIAYGTWFPCIKLKGAGVGTYVIFNPFAADPEGIAPIYTPESKISSSQIESALSQFVIFNGFQNLHETPVEFDQVFTYENENGKFAPIEHIIDSTGTMVAFRFKNGLDAENFAQNNVERKHNDQNLYFLDNSTLVASVIELFKKQGDAEALFAGESQAESFTKILTWVKRNLSTFSQRSSLDDEQEIKALVALSEEVIVKGSSIKPQEGGLGAPLENLSLKYMNKGDGLLVSQGNQLKLLYKENGKFVAKAGLFVNRPKTPKDEIILTLPRAAFINVLTQLDLKSNASKLFNHITAITSANEFLTALKNGLDKTQNTQEVNIQLPYRSAKIFISILLASLFNSLKWLKSLIQEASDTIDAAKGKIPPVEKSATEKKRTQRRRSALIFNNLSINQIYYLLHILLSVDETLYTMILHNQCSSSLKKYWPNKTPRLFTAFGRLGTLLTYPSNKFSLVQIAEAGLYNTQDILLDIKHFLDPEKRIEEIQNLRGDEDLWSLLQKSLTQNRMVQGLPSENVPLHVSLNNLPAQQHSSDPEQKIINIATNDKTNIVSTVSQNGEVKLWNTELALVELGVSGYRKKLKSKKLAGLKGNNAVDAGDIDDEVEVEVVEEVAEVVAPTVDANFVPSDELMDMLLAMGFPYELATKALFEVNNSNIDSAIEKIEKLREAEKAAPPKKETQAPAEKKPAATVVVKKKVVYDFTRIKPVWECAACTFVNNNARYCGICGCQAPVTAYFAKDEAAEQEEEQEEQKPAVVEKKTEASESTEKPTQAQVPQKNFTETAKIKGNFIVPLHSSPLSPAIVGVIFEDEAENSNKYQIRLRRYAYNSSYVSQFIQKDKEKGQYSLLSVAWFNQDSLAVHRNLTNEYGLAFKTLYPLFTELPSKKNILEAFDEVDFHVDSPSGKLVGVTVLSDENSKEKETAYVYLLWENNSKYTLQQLTVTNNATNPYESAQNKTASYEVKTGATHSLDLKGKYIKLEVNNERLIIVTDQQVQSFQPLKLEAPVNTFPVTAGNNFTGAQLINSNTLLILGQRGSSQTIKLDEGAHPVEKEASSSEDSSSSASLQIPDVNTLTEENIDSICRSLHQRPLEGESLQGDAIIQSNLQNKSNKNARFFLPVDSNGNDQTLEVNFARPSSLTNVEISLYFDLPSSKRIETIDEEHAFISNLQREEPAGSSEADKAGKAAEKKDDSVVIPNLNMVEGDSTDKFLPITVVSFKGASQSEGYPVSKLLSPNNEVFCSNYPNSEFIFKHLHEKAMLVKSVTVHSKLNSVGKNSFPINSGLVFTANYLSHFDMTKPFHNMKHEEFQQWYKTRSEQRDALLPWEPVGSFQFNEKEETVTVNLAYTRPSKYIMLKPTSVRAPSEEPEQNLGVEPIEIKFFGVSGSVVAEQVITEVREITSQHNIGVAKEVELVLEGQTKEQKWVTLQNLKDVVVQSVVDNQSSLQKHWQNLSTLPLWGSSLEVVKNDALFQGRFSKIRVRVVKSGNRSSPSSWVLSGLSLQAYTTNHIGEKASLGTSPAVLRNLLLDPKEFSKLNLNLIKSLTNPDYSNTKRAKITNLISDILTLEPNLTNLFYKSLDMKNFLQASVLQERKSSFLEIQNLFQHFSTQNAFAQNLLEGIINILPSLSSANTVTLAGLNGFFSLLTWCQTLQPNQVFTTLLTELHKLSQKITKVRTPEYNALRSQYKVLSFVLDPELFSETNVSTKNRKRKSKEDTTDKTKEKEKTPLKSTFLASFQHDVDEYLVDLGQKCSISEVRLAFDRSSKTFRFRVQIWALAENNGSQKELLLHSKLYPESTWIQLTNYAYDRQNVESNYKPTEELECLGFNNLATSARYLRVQITYAILPFIQTSPSEKRDTKIIPEVYGEPIANESGEIAEIQALFNIKNKVQKDAISYSHSVKYDKAEVTGKNVAYKYIFTASETQAKDKAQESEASGLQDNEEILKTQLQEFQASLHNKLKGAHNPVSDYDEITRLSSSIEELQVRLFNINSLKSSATTVEFSKSLDYLYTLALKLAQALERIETSSLIQERPWRGAETYKGKQGQKTAYEIFENLVAYENGPVSGEFINLLANHIIKNLNDKERQAIVLDIVDNFLAAPAKDAPLYSHLHIIDALHRISVPQKELLDYVVNKLKIPTDGSGAKKASVEEDSTKISTLVSILLLLSKHSTAASTTEQKGEKEKVRQAYYICVWICQHLSAENSDTANVLSLGFDVLVQVLSQGESSVVRDILKDSQSFLKLFMSVVKINSLDLLTKFKSVLQTILSSKSELIDEGVTEESKTLLLGNLKTALIWLTNYAIKSERIPLDTEGSQQEEQLSVNNWFNNICFILEFLLSESNKKKTGDAAVEAETKSKVIEDQSQPASQLSVKEESLNNVGSSKDVGDAPSSGATKTAVEIIPTETLLQLILLLSSETPGRSGYTLGGSTKSWSLVMKLALQVKIEVFVDSKILSNLIKAFLLSSKETQNVILSQIIRLSKKLINQQTNQKEFTTIIISVIFSTLDSFANDSKSIGYVLFRSLLDILLTGDSPQPENLQNKPILKAFSHISQQGILTLFTSLSKYLWTNLNFGSSEGAQCSSDLHLQRLNLGDQLLKFLVLAQSSTTQLAISELFSDFKKYSQDIQASIRIFIQWYLLNKADSSVQSPSTHAVKNICESIVNLFEIMDENQDVVKIAISALVAGCKEVDKTLARLQSTQQISAYLIYQYSIRSCSVLEELFNLWINNDTIASYAVLEVKCFEYLLEKISFIEDNSKTSVKASASSYLKGTDLLSGITSSKPTTSKPEVRTRLSEGSSATTTTEPPKEDEFANKLTLINQENQSWSGITPDWTTNKKGNKGRVLFFLMNGSFYNEYSLLLKLDKNIEVSQIKIGFNTSWTEYTEKVLGIPSKVIIEGGSSETDLSYLGTLEPMNDFSLSEFAVKNYAKNFKTISSNSEHTVQSAIASISQKKLTHLRFRFQRPVLNLVEGLSSQGSTQAYKNIAVSISFISIMGVEIKKLSDVTQKIVETQEKSALQTISKLCNPQFIKTLEVIANERAVVNNIKSSFDVLSSLLVHHEAWLAPIFLALASYNTEMGDWIINRFLDPERAKEHTKIIAEIALSNYDFIFARTFQINQFILSELKSILLLTKAESMSKFNRLIPFIEVFCTVLRSIPIEFAQKHAEHPVEIPFTQENLDIIIQSYEQYNASAHSKLLIKLMLIHLYVPAPFVLKDQALIKYALEKLWSLVNQEKKFLYYEMMGPLIVGSTYSAKWFLTHLETALNEIMASLENFADANLKTLRYSFTLLNNISSHDLIKKKLFSNQWHLKIYDMLKNKDQKSKKVLKKLDQDILRLSVDFLKNVTLGFTQAEEDLAKALIEDIDQLDTTKDLLFVNNLLGPLLNAETELPVCLYPLNTQTGRVITDLKRLPAPKTITTLQSTNTFKSQFLTDSQSQTLLKTIQTLTTASGASKKLKNSSWELGFTNTIDGENLLYSIKEKLSKKGPFLVLVNGLNGDKKCVIGVFSSQGIPEMQQDVNQQEDMSYTISHTDDNFLFYYSDNNCLHFKIPPNEDQEAFGTLQTFYDGGGCLSFFHQGIERLYLSFTSYQPTFADMNLREMKPLESDTKQGVPEDFITEFVFQSAEYWVLKSEEKPIQAQQAPKTSAVGESDIINSAFLATWHNTTQPFNYFRAAPVYHVPSTLSAEKLSEIALNSDVPLSMRLTKEKLEAKSLLADVYEFIRDRAETNGIIDLEFDAFQMIERKFPKKAANAITGEPEELKYKPALTFFETFEKSEGVKKIIDVGIRALDKWKDKTEAKKWRSWLQDLSSFGALPNFFGLFLKNKDCMNLLFKILTGDLDKMHADESSPEKKVDEKEHKAIKYAYQILAEVFGVDNDPKLRELAIEKQFFNRILERLSIISKEGKRKWYDDYQKREKEEEEKSSPEKKAEKDEGYTKKIAKKKGVGYASDNTGENQKWDVTEYVESKKAKNEQLQSVLDILSSFFDAKDWQPSQQVLHKICESCLLPLLEATFRSASLLDMAKEATLNHAYLKLTRSIAPNKGLLPCLLELDRHYQPPQKDSIYTLLNNLKDLAQIFLNCLTSADKESAGTNQKLAQDILDTYHVVDAAIQASQEFEEGNEAEILDILAQPLQVAYRTLLQNLRFDYVSMKDMTTAKFNHHYASYINETTPSQQKMVRLAQELADLSSALPIEHTNSIFVRVDESRVDVMKAIIMGAAGTPYGHGAYEYDIYFDDSYPNAPPKVNLTTTGGGKVRFNPNLYHCGKVCLSLLGTWRGNASENWDPKLSTLLQVLVSIQAIIMSDDIYFNEPGYEGEAGTEEGEKKNEAYCNIVRYCNIQYAMLEQIKNPPKGFETVIRRHFYLKKDEILEELQKWVKYAEHRGASYSGLVNDHNSSWCTTFKGTKTKYKEMLVDAIKELEKELNKLQPPSGKDVKQKVLKKKEKKVQKVNIEAGVANLEDVDVTYEKDQVVKHKEMDIQDENVKDRWSRYIGAMGLDAVTKQANATIFLSGLGALGLEVTKNIVLSGVKRLTIHDSSKATFRDLSGQFFLGEEDVGKNRAEASLNKIQQLNYYVKVDTTLLNQKLPKEESELEKLLKGYTLVILTENDYETQIAVNNYCRKNKIYFISTDAYGPFASTFSDFGDEFVVLDKNGEELQEVMIGKITNEEKGLVTLLPGHTHKFEDGDLVVIYGVEGMSLTDNKPEIEASKEESSSNINNTKHIIQVVNANSFRIGDTSGYTEYVRNGLAKPLKTPISVKFKPLQDSLVGQVPFDSNMVMHDFLKISHPTILHVAFQALDQFVKKNSGFPKPWNVADSDKLVEIAYEVAKSVKDYNPTEDKRFEFVLRRFAFTCQGVFSPLTAFLGGYIAQEAVKAITQKFMPTQQFFYTDCYEVIPELPEEKEQLEEAIKKLGVQEKNHRSDGLRIIVGEALLEELKYTNLFMVGAGAIGCELLKNYAMLGIGTGEAGKNGRKEGGKILLTDPDVIEVSNLNRQFLFREKHLRKPKSQTAAAAAIQMNKELKGHVIARLDKVHEGTSNIFTDKFFEELTVVTNALDNVQARRYIDLRCVSAKTPLLESGTLGPKGHVQVIIPYKTESYSSQEDPKDEAEIPHCTLKMFPEETLHCVEWARDKFGKLFTQRPKGLLKALENPNPQTTDPQEVKALREAASLIDKKPNNFDDCIKYARLKFQKYFVNDIRQLLYTYPLDFKTKEGRPFWSLPKRPPTEIIFDPKNLLHASLVTACACLRANVFNIPIPSDARKDAGKLKIAEEAAKIKVVDFKPSDEKAKEINSQVKKDEAGDVPPGVEEDIQDEGEIKENEIKDLLKKIGDYGKEVGQEKEKSIKPEEFEKDNDQNFHIDFIYALANCRANNYKLEAMEWITVKLKAGRIVPALATTTASVAGLQTIELCKLLKKCKVEDMKNAFLSLAVPILALSEPGVAPKTKLHDKLEVNIWDRWDVSLPREATLKDLYDNLEKTYELKPKDVTHGTNTIYFHALMDIKGKEKEKEEKLNSKLEDLLGFEKEDKYADLSVMFSRKGESEILKGVPFVRVTLG